MRLLRSSLALSLLAAAAAAAAAPLAAQGAMRAAPSTRATTTVELTFADTAAQRAAGKPALIHVDYGQPHLRGRRINTDSLVPFDQVWRLGANAATLLTTDVDLTIGGQAVPKGRYVAQALPTRSGWTLILQAETSGAAQVMPTGYDQAKDAARIPLRLATLSAPVESLSIWLIPAAGPGAARGELRIAWGTVELTADWAVR